MKPQTESGSLSRFRTWKSINDYMADGYLKWYTPAELRQMEVKWRKVMAEAGWSIKGP